MATAKLKCDVAICGRDAVFLVHFRVGGVYPYCRFHSYDLRGNPRWRQVHLRNIERIR